VLATTIHWDEFIAGYNLKRRDTVELDVYFLLSLSDKTLPLLEANKMALQDRANKETPKVEGIDDSLNKDWCSDMLKMREAEFVKRQQQFSWLSWNYADDYTMRYFKKKKTIAATH
jgi:hypothetical protein